MPKPKSKSIKDDDHSKKGKTVKKASQVAEESKVQSETKTEQADALAAATSSSNEITPSLSDDIHKQENLQSITQTEAVKYDEPVLTSIVVEK